jgi:hypothetical protein
VNRKKDEEDGLIRWKIQRIRGREETEGNNEGDGIIDEKRQ